MKKKRKGWLARLFDMNDASVSASTVFLVICSVTAIILLLIPAIVLLDEVIHNHTITTDLNGLAAYITACLGFFVTGGLLKGWTTYSNYRFNTGKEKIEELANTIKNKAEELIEEDCEDDDE